MKFKDPSLVTCPACSGTSSHRVKDLLAGRAKCPKCQWALVEIGQQMQRHLDEWREFVTAISLSIEIEDQSPTLRYNDGLLTTVHTLQDLVAATETLMIDVPAAERHVSAVKVVKEAFRAVFPDVTFPPMGKNLAVALRGIDIPLFGARRTGNP